MVHRHIFRMTHFRNMEQLVADGAIHAREFARQKQYAISYEQINNKRGNTLLTPDGLSLHHYVPFYFSPVTAMACAIHLENVPLRDPDGNALGQASLNEVVFLVSNTGRFADGSRPFWFTNVACNTMSLRPEYSNDLSQLDAHINWSVFDEGPRRAHIPEVNYPGVCRYFHDQDTVGRQNRKAERMAEFLVRDTLPLDMIDCIVTKSGDIKDVIEQWLMTTKHQIPSYVKPGCYF